MIRSRGGLSMMTEGCLGCFGSPFTFTGELLDANDLLYLRARYYSPALGAFTANDPAEGVPQQPMSLNGYSWVEGNVPNLTDPNGRQACECQCEGLSGIELAACIMSCFSQGYLYFPYTRQNAAEKARAMAEGRDNDLARFAISGTSSARFISLALHAGGLPMTVEPGQTDCNTQVLDRPVQAWCAKAVGSQLEGSRTWLVHNSQTDDETAPIDNLARDIRLIGYLLGNPEVLGPDICYSGGGYYDMVSVEEVFGTPEELRTDAVSTIEHFSNNTMLPTDSPPIYDVYGNAGLATRIQQVMSRLSGFEIGDYIFTGGKEEHGFMVVDKGPAVRCDDLSTVLADVPVFWVADLPGNQRGTSRPFYCSRLVDPQTGSWFTARFWYFIKVPGGVWVRGNRLYRNDPLR